MINVLRYIGIVLLCMMAGHAAAQNVAESAKDVFCHYTDSLWTQGNKYYFLSNRIGIKQCADLMSAAVDQRLAKGMMTIEEADSIRQYIWKLMGSYHYENSDLDMQSYTKANEYYQRALKYAVEHSSQQPSYFNQYILHRELAQLYYKQSRYPEARDEMEESMRMAENYCSEEDYLDVLSQYAICQARCGFFSLALEDIQQVIDNYIHTDTERYGEALRKKAKILMLQQEEKGTSATEALGLYRKYYDLKRRDALKHFQNMSSSEREQYWMRIRPFVTDCYRLEDADAAFLYDVTLFAKGLLLQLDRNGGGSQSLQVNWQTVQARLPQKGCAIEFIQYEKNGAQRMAALVLSKTGKPCFVPMPAPDSIYNYNVASRTVRERLYDVHGNIKNVLYQEDMSGLSGLLWNKTLLKAIGPAQSVYFAPDGYIHQLAIEYMLPHDAPQFDLYRLTSTRRLTEGPQQFHADKALIIGGVNYVEREETGTSGNDATAYRYAQQKRFGFRYLEHSLAEVNSIRALRQMAGDSLLTGRFATEQAFRELCHSYSMIHLSSHGVFGAASISQGTDIKPCLADSSLSECFVALAGLQASLDNQSFDVKRQDGILSARELSSLDMSSVGLVVLACCETGLGYVTSDGVYGIQRGLKNAGVTALIVSLWDVDDEATTLFTILLHSNLRQGMSIHQAFRKARESLRTYRVEQPETQFNAATMSGNADDFEEDLPFDKPQYYNAFILIDAI